MDLRKEFELLNSRYFDEALIEKSVELAQKYAEHYHSLQLQQGGVSSSVLIYNKRLEEKIIDFVKEKLKTEKIVIDMIFKDGYQVYYNGEYVGNVKHLYDTFL